MNLMEDTKILKYHGLYKCADMWPKAVGSILERWWQKRSYSADWFTDTEGQFEKRTEILLEFTAFSFQ